jgi:hypothetical protein
VGELASSPQAQRHTSAARGPHEHGRVVVTLEDV